MVLFEFVLLGGDIFDNRIRQVFLALSSPVICQRIVDAEGKRLLLALEPLDGGFSLPKLFIGQARDCCANSSPAEIAGIAISIISFNGNKPSACFHR
jgi:hypothetical protein